MTQAFASYSDQIKDWVSTGKFPGIHVNVDEAHTLTTGYADVDAQRPLHPHSLFRLASASKLFLSVAALKLVDQKILRLNQSVRDILPEYPASMTVMDLLRHSCGYGYGDTEPYGDALRAAGLLRTDELGMNNWVHDMDLRGWAEVLASVTVEDEPGTVVRYGLGHDILGAVMETVCSKPLDEVLRDFLIAPLQLRDTFFVVPEARRDDLTAFYHHDNDRLELIEAAEDSAFLRRPKAFSGGGGWDMLGNGGLVSSQVDINRLLKLILTNGSLAGETFLSPETNQLLLSSQTGELKVSEMQPGCGYSLGVACVDSPDGYLGLAPKGTLYWGGSTNTFYFYQPETNRCGVFLTHTFPFAHENAIYQFLKLSSA